MDRNTVQVLACPQCGGKLQISPASAPSSQFDDPTFDNLLEAASAAPFGGWDLSWLAERCTTTTADEERPLIEAYDSRARELLRSATSVLDLGTGGGEHLAQLRPLPPLTLATETYAPNVTLAADRLVPLGVRVIQADPNTHRGDGPQPGNRWPERRLPLADKSFDLVLASRSAFSPVEIARVLRPGGHLLTIQNGVEWRGETLSDALAGTPPEWTRPGQGWNVGETFRQSGLRIRTWREQATATTYHDIGAVVYMLLHVPWLVVDFDVVRFRDRLYRLHQRIQVEGAFTTRGYVYLIEAEKP